MHHNLRLPSRYSGTAFGQSPFAKPQIKESSPRPMPKSGSKSGISPLAQSLWEQPSRTYAPSFRRIQKTAVADDGLQEGYPIRPYPLFPYAKRGMESEEDTDDADDTERSPVLSKKSLDFGAFSEEALLLALFFCLAKEGADPLLLLSLGFLLVSGGALTSLF